MPITVFLFALLSFQASPAIDNQRVQVLEVDTGMVVPPYDSVLVSRTGDVAFVRKSVKLKTEGKGILIGLKDFKVEPLANKSGYPLALPRPGSKKVLENARVIVWDYTWTPGVPTPMHFHDKDVVVMFLEDGALQSTLPSGEKGDLNEYKPGVFRFNARNRTHNETLVRGKQHAIITELK